MYLKRSTQCPAYSKYSITGSCYVSFILGEGLLKELCHVILLLGITKEQHSAWHTAEGIHECLIMLVSNTIKWKKLPFRLEIHRCQHVNICGHRLPHILYSLGSLQTHLQALLICVHLVGQSHFKHLSLSWVFIFTLRTLIPNPQTCHSINWVNVLNMHSRQYQLEVS